MFDTYFFNITNQPYGKGIFQVIDPYGNPLPPPPVNAGYRVTTDGVTTYGTRALTFDGLRATTTF